MLYFKSFSIAFITLGLLFAGVEIHAEDLKWSPDLIQGELSNGFEYVFHQSTNPKEPFNLRLIVNAGSVDDEQRGMAHIVEHMVFRANRAYEIDVHRYFDQIGWQTGKQVNALTRQTETQYMIRTRLQDALNIEQSVKLLSDLAFGAKMLDNEWQIERGVILEEMRKGAGVAERVNTAKKEIIRHGSRYVDRPTIGTKEDILAIDIEAIRHFYNQFYIPGNMTLVASGNVDSTRLVKAIETHFGKAEAKPIPIRDYVELPLKEGLVIGKVQDPKGTSSAVAYGFRTALKPSIKEEGAYQRLQNYFLRKLVMPMVRDSVEVYKAKAESVSITFSEPTNERFIVAIAARTKDHATGLEIVLNEIERLKQNGIQEQELQALKEKAKVSIARNQELIPKRDFAKWEDKLTTAVMQNGVEEDYGIKSARNLKWIDEITVESLNTRLRALLSAPDQFMYYQIPGNVEKTLPTVKEVQALANQIANKKLEQIVKAPQKEVSQTSTFKDEELKAEKIILPKKEVKPAMLLSKHQYFSPQVTQWKLANGDNVVWLNKKTPKDELYIKALSKAGFYNKEQAPWVWQAAQQIWQQSDFLSISNKELDSWQTQNNAKWHWAHKKSELDLSAKVSKQNLESLMNAYLIMQTDWQLEEKQFANILDNLKGLVKQTTADEIERNTFLGTKLQLAPTEQALNALTFENFKAAIKQLNQQVVSLYIVGQSSEAEIEALVLPYLAKIKRQPQLEAYQPSLPAGNHRLSQQMHDENKATVSIKAESGMSWSPEASFLVSTLNPIVQKALKNKLRNELGGIYSLRYEMVLGKDNKVRMSTNFTTAPEKVETLIKAHNQVLDKLSSQLKKENYQRIQEDIRFAESLRLADPNTWLRRLSLSFERYQTPEYLRSMLTLEKQVTQDKLEQFIKEIIPVSKQAILIGMPKSSLKPTQG